MGNYRKAIAAAILAGLSAAAAGGTWVVIVASMLIAGAGVWAVPNRKRPAGPAA